MGYKKLPCHFYHINGSCVHGEGCTFSHQGESLGYCPSNKCRICKTHKVIQKGVKHKYQLPKKQQVKQKEQEDVMIKQQSQKIVQEKNQEIKIGEDEGNQIKENLFSKRLEIIHQDLKIFKQVQKGFHKNQSLDIMFILDCTGSMGSWIKAAKNQLKSIIEYILQQFAHAKIRVSIVAYRDFCDKDKIIQFSQFTDSIDATYVFLSKLAAFGGGDTPEDLCGALEQALKADWKAQAKYGILITDAPCHGQKYHNSKDSYPNGDPNGRNPEVLLQKIAKLGINLYGVRITNLTDKMFDILSDVYQKITLKPIEIANLGNSSNQLGFFVANTVTLTLSNSVFKGQVSMIRNAIQQLKQMRNNKLTQEQQIQKLKHNVQSYAKLTQIQPVLKKQESQIIKLEIRKQQPNWYQLKNSAILKCICYTFFIVKDKGVPINWRKPLIQTSQISTQMQISKQPFSQGAMRYAFYAFDKTLLQNMVVKISKKQKQNNIQVMKKQMQTIFICQHIVNDYNDRIINKVPDHRLLLNFVHSFVVQVLDKNPFQYYYAQNYIKGVYQKYNNNAGWVNNNKVGESSFISQAFSHFSWQITMGYLLIVDLQGASGILTDPQIHCLDEFRFGSGNLGYEGIMKFFLTHQCNKYCKDLSLINPKFQFKIGEQKAFFSQAVNPPKNPKEKINTICDLCRQPFKIQAKTLYDKRKNDYGKQCHDCMVKKKQSMKKGKCEWCDAVFVSSQYWFKMKRTDFPILCQDCRKKKREKLRAQRQKQQI